MDSLIWLQKWFAKQCDGDWEHSYGISIETLDNPGWRVKISLQNIDVEQKDIVILNSERNESDWIHCKIAYDKELDGIYFWGYGGIENLGEILDSFRRWVDCR
ncbi:immunity 53 family protein [Neobacillus sp. DY30]|uniref:immunity 53 family protein n=1 Tax=Neobacillus sp. DY30 TaxID=3047871 RepID=UPI0024C0043F|nr:immunity 53 family protein [Neobacillus sp. DY30]WHY01339.1 immunity 53 family protein [Neobacillus sp. DY30]